MNFNSLHFAVFLPLVFALYWSLPHRFRWFLLLLSSYYFYMSWNAKYVFLILFTTVISYAAAILLEENPRHGRRKLILGGTLIACLGVLLLFKYGNFLLESIAGLLSVFAIPFHPVTLRLLLPVGISFYTFQTLSYVIDVYRGRIKAERHFGIYATFVSFFPQLVAGPIERSENLLPQIKAEHQFDYDQASYGMKLMTWGFFKKMVIADNLALYVDRIYNNVLQYYGFSLILATVFFTIQIYCDFSGYSDIARGAAKLMGIELMENFKSPYFSTSIREFWKRWHISLSTWFRDYVYIPLGGNRVKKWKRSLNLLTTFLLSGLWHGANWTFVIWGGVHGGAQLLEDALQIRSLRETAKGNETDISQPPKHVWRNRIFFVIRTGLVFAFVSLAWAFFRAQTLTEALHIFHHALDGIQAPVQYLLNGFHDIKMGKAKLSFCLLLYFFPLTLYDAASLKTDVIAWVGRRRFFIRHLIYAALVLAVLFFQAIGKVEFIYFQF